MVPFLHKEFICIAEADVQGHSRNMAAIRAAFSLAPDGCPETLQGHSRFWQFHFPGARYQRAIIRESAKESTGSNVREKKYTRAAIGARDRTRLRSAGDARKL